MKRTGEQAFSLIELMVALAILMIGVYSLADLLGSSRHAASMGDERITALSLGRMKLREFEAAREQVPALLANQAEAKYPQEGPKPFEENPSLLWQAHFRRPGSGNGIEVSVDIRTRRGDTVTSVGGVLIAGPLAQAPGSEIQ